MSVVSRFKYPVSILSLLVLPLLASCGGGYNPDAPGTPGNTGTPGGAGTKSGLQLNVPIPPTVSWKSSNSTTQMIMQFSVRDNAGQPLAANEFDVQIRVNDGPPDTESLLSQSAEDLKVNLYFGMVLDASYSMTQHTPPAFVPMKNAARDSYQEVLDLWKNRPGEVKFSMVWFDAVLNQSQDVPSAARYWQPADILAIPTPTPGAFTKLYSAVDVMAKNMRSQYDKGVFSGARDQYVMLVFSDGADNYSWVDNSASRPSQPLITDTSASYNQFGTLPTTLEAAKQSIANHPRLTTHVIGLGSAINKDELQQIATAGHGTFQSNPSSENVAQLFQSVMKEFTTLQTRGAEIPLPPGDYKITLVVTNKATGQAGQYNFKIRAGGPDAKVITAPL